MSASRDAFLLIPGNDPWDDEPPTGGKTMNATHTPGPWEYPTYEGSSSCTIPVVAKGVPKPNLNGNTVAMVLRPADARLIAAAPDLLAACIALQSEASDRGCGLRIADAAIAKAIGR